MDTITNWFLTGVLTYGAPVLATGLLIAALGIPIPSSLLVIAGGAFIRQGLINPYQAALMGLAAAVLGDTISYGLGRFAGQGVERRYHATAPWQSAQGYFQKYGGFSVYITRWLVLALAIPVNLLAGSTKYNYRRFFLFSFTGELTWITLYGSVGYIFGEQWQEISTFISDSGGLLAGVVILSAGIYLAIRWWRKKPAAADANPTPPVSQSARID